MKTHFNSILRGLIPVLLCVVALSFEAGEETVKVRVVGLSDASRADDFRSTAKTMADIELASIDYETAEATFKYEPVKLISGYNPKKPPTAEAILKRIGELMNSASQGTFLIKPLATLEKDKMKVEEIPIGILDCKGCRYAAYISIAKIEGVEQVKLNAEKSTIAAWIDPAKTNRAALEDALKKAHVELPGK